MFALFVTPIAGAAIELLLDGRTPRLTWLSVTFFGGLALLAAREVRTLIRPKELRIHGDRLEVARGDQILISLPWEWIRDIEYFGWRSRGIIPIDDLTITYLDLEASVPGNTAVRELKFRHTWGIDSRELVGILRSLSPSLTEE